jgi:signal transduction histidine kinase
LNTARAFISLVDRTSQYILIEATQNSCLAPDSSCDNGEDHLLFGRATLPRSQGLCGYALDVLSPEKAGLYQRASRQSPLVVKDLVHDDHFKYRHFATNHPSVRFYAAVPINTKSGFSIGTLSVMSERPREGLSDTETELMTDLAHAIAAHLEITKSNEGHRRSEKMIKGLGMFMQGRADLSDWWLELGNNDPRRRQEPEEITLGKSSKTRNPSLVPTMASLSDVSPGNIAKANNSELSPSLDGHSKVTEAIPVRPQDESDFPVDTQTDPSAHRASPSRKPETLPDRFTSESTTAADATRRASSTGQSARTITPDFQESLISKRLKKMFSRACHIIQDCIEVDGAIFLDASVTTLSEHSSEPSASTAQSQGLEEKTCGVLGFCTGENSSMHGEMASTLKPLTEVFLQSLFSKYPQGHVFNRDERRQLMSDTMDPDRRSLPHEAAARSDSTKRTSPHSQETAESAEEKALLKMLPGTKSIAFIPLWDSHRERWFAGSFMWTVERTTRVLTHSEDLHYLAAFGNCIMAEVARLDVVGADRAKSDFISSISHELRSPLHGILASVELLQDTNVDLFQHAMVDTIERCGRTLLDTIQHVLDFAKINNFTSFKVEERIAGRPDLLRSLSGMPSLSVDVDLSLLTEDVVDSVFAGHEFQGNSSLVVTDEASGYPPEGLRRNKSISTEDKADRIPHTSKKARIDVVMDIGWRSNWVFSTQSGALRRVLMNLFGNALKYTESGWVKVSLQAEDIKPAPSQPQQSVITISVRDTGRGISQDYFHSGLFTPFTQENSMNSGTGLGLSIVLQIVRSLGGTIDITSEQGVGTEVLVTLTLNQASPADSPSLAREGASIIQKARQMTSGLTIGLVGLDETTGNLKRRADDHKLVSEPGLFLQASIEGAATQWFDMQVADPSTFKSSAPDILIENE